MQVSDLGKGSTTPTPAYSGNSEAKQTKQQKDMFIKVQDEVARMIELTSLELVGPAAGLRGKSGKPTGEVPFETTGRYNQTESSYK